MIAMQQVLWRVSEAFWFIFALNERTGFEKFHGTKTGQNKKNKLVSISFNN